ncbi:alpha/beta fold hydrolase [Pseudoscardovia radai]|uniref:alpha/beta fold hydrolase n=1 Tax=Pseudoscardovia radai TaxID=987066 RepID=UPI003991789F
MRRWTKASVAVLTAIGLFAPSLAQAQTVDSARDVEAMQTISASDAAVLAATVSDGTTDGSVDDTAGIGTTSDPVLDNTVQHLEDVSAQVDEQKASGGFSSSLGSSGGEAATKDDVPNPLDFASIKEDDAFYNLPALANQYKTTDSSGNTVLKLTGPTAGGASQGAVPQGLEAYYSQSLTWTNCPTAGFVPGWGYTSDTPTEAIERWGNATCTYASVPLDYSNPSSQSIKIAVLKVPHSPGYEKYGTIFINPGGPGGSGTQYAFYATRSELTRHYDVIGFDPRGVGSSLPQIRCQSNQARDWQREGSDALTNAQLDQIDKYNASECYANTARGYSGITSQEFLPTVGTDTVAKDMDVLRSALGEEKLTYRGFSYGTVLGTHYAMQFPGNVQAMVLDGDENYLSTNSSLAADARYQQFGDATVSRGSSQASAFDDTFRKFLGWCLSDSSVETCALGNKVSGTPTDAQIDAAYAEYQRLARLNFGGAYLKKKADTNGPRVLSFADFVQGTTEALYSTSYWPTLNSALESFANDKDPSGMLALADQYEGREGGEYDFSQAAFHVIYSMDNNNDNLDTPEEDVYSDVDRAKEMKEYYALAPYRDPGTDENGNQRGLATGLGLGEYLTGTGTLAKAFEVSTIPNILFISSTYDPATPYENGFVDARAFHAVMLAVGYDAHCAYGSVSCATSVADEFLTDPSAFMAKVDSNGFANEVQWKDSTDGSAQDIFRTSIADGECRLVSFRQTGGDGTIVSSSSGLTSANKTNAEMRGTSVTLKTVSADGTVSDATQLHPGDDFRLYLNSMPTDCTVTGAECTYTPYLYDAGSDAAGTPLGAARGTLQDSTGYFIAGTIPSSTTAGSYKLAVYRSNGWLYGWAAVTVAGAPSTTSAPFAMLRVYNPNSSEHFFTASSEERANLVKAGWRYEGTAWTAPVSGDPVYRLYNPNRGEHHYTTDSGEANTLMHLGWRFEGIGWYSAPSDSGSAVYRVYNPNAPANNHHYTASAAERDQLVANGWRDEGTAWYGVKE